MTSPQIDYYCLARIKMLSLLNMELYLDNYFLYLGHWSPRGTVKLSYAHYFMGAFNNYVDRFVAFFDHSTTPRRQFIYQDLFTCVDI